MEVIKQVLLEQYGLEMVSADKALVGAGSDTWFVTCEDGKYVLKYPAKSEINNPEYEPELCAYLIEQGIPVCQFLKNWQDRYLSVDAQGRVFHVQKFIEGSTYDWHTAPKWLLTEQAGMLGRIHNALRDYSGLPIGIGRGFFEYMTPKRALSSYQKSLGIARDRSDSDEAEDLEYRIGLIKRFPRFEFELNKLTCQSTHGDYFISQLICGEDKIYAVIDWTTACVHPVVWEIMRSYVYAAPECKSGNIDVGEFASYVREYCKYAELTKYDLANMAKLFYYQIAVCDYYGQYYAAADTGNSYIYLEQAKLSTKLLKWFEKNVESMTERLMEEV